METINNAWVELTLTIIKDVVDAYRLYCLARAVARQMRRLVRRLVE